MIYQVREDQKQDQAESVQDQAVSMVQRATVTLQPDFKQQIYSLLENEDPYSSILSELNDSDSSEVSRGRMKYRK